MYVLIDLQIIKYQYTYQQWRSQHFGVFFEGGGGGVGRLPGEQMWCAWLCRWAEVIPTDGPIGFQGLNRKAAGD